MSKSKVALFLLVLFVVVPLNAQAQSWRGMGRIQGVVLDADGKPVEGALVRLRSERASNTGPDVKTDKRGKFGAAGLIGGAWNIDIEASGFLTRQLSANVSEVQRLPPMEIRIERIPEPEPQPEQPVASTVPPEAVAAVQAGEAFMADQKYKEAIVEFEKAQAVLPDHMQLKQVLARAYYGAGQLKPAIALLKQVYAADPTNVGVLTLLTTLLIEDGHIEEGKEMLKKIPEGTMSDPTALVNLGILFLNKNNPQDALEWFTKAVNLDPSRGESYYYRGLASLQLKNVADAKADFQKVVELAPNSTEAKDAQEMLKSLR